jgi:hypothetical protein
MTFPRTVLTLSAYRSSMICSESRYTLFGIML